VPKFHLVFLIHSHQPVGNFDDVLERAYEHSYSPFVGLLEQHPSVRMGLHYSGSLLEWFEGKHPEFLGRLRVLVARNQIELATGGYFEPILISILPEDRQEQIRRLSEYLEKHFGRRPRGAWLTERVWEPELASTLARAGVEYTLIDDNHFLGAGLGLGQLYGDYLAEDQGATVRVIPGLKALRYLVPYRDPAETIEFLRGFAREHPEGMAAMGDDCEKFGVWPKSYEHCYVDGWLERFFAALEANSDWLATATPAEALAARAPLGRTYLPATSYTEMTEWALPAEAQQRFHNLTGEFSSRPDVLAFLRGGIWRNFLSKYSEANLLHKKMLHVSTKVQRLARKQRRGEAFERKREEAETSLLSAQCNDAYWHGVFGGLYSPHLRTALWRALVRAESFADSAEHKKAHYAAVSKLDFDADGRDEIYLTSNRYAALIAPADGGTISLLDFRPSEVTLINSLTRRREAYHAKVYGLSGGEGSGAVSIHDQARAKEAGLERWLRYDRWQRHAFRLLLFSPGKTQEDYETLRLDEDASLAGGSYRVLEAEATRVSLASDEVQSPGTSKQVAGSGWRAEKAFSFSPAGRGFEIRCDFSLSHSQSAAAPMQVGLEVVLNLLAPNVPDRYFESAGQRHPLRWSAAVPASELRIVDHWQKVGITLQAPSAAHFWIAPIETVSESEDGFERVYQGSQILTVWPAEVSAGTPWTGQLTLRIDRAG
jgi:hypothetical protein